MGWYQVKFTDSARATEYAFVQVGSEEEAKRISREEHRYRLDLDGIKSISILGRVSSEEKTKELIRHYSYPSRMMYKDGSSLRPNDLK